MAQTTSQQHFSPFSSMEVAVPRKSLRSGLVSIETLASKALTSKRSSDYSSHNAPLPSYPI